MTLDPAELELLEALRLDAGLPAVAERGASSGDIPLVVAEAERLTAARAAAHRTGGRLGEADDARLRWARALALRLVRERDRRERRP